MSAEPDPGAMPAPLSTLRSRIDRDLRDALDRSLDRLVGYSPALGPVAAELRAFAASGKRIRPALLLMGYQAAGGGDTESVMGPALALELLHTCALVHDDVIDRAGTRRGRPTVHHAFTDQHRRSGWTGDGGDFGQSMAILVGDLAFVYADERFLASFVPDERLLAAFRRFTVLREEVMAGQTLDLHAAVTGLADRDDALMVATLKSGRYSVARPLEIGALLCGAPPELVDGLGAFGDPLGRAFQIRDDILGVFGDDAVTGKSTASDLAEGKRTLLIAEAVARLGPADRETLLGDLGDPGLDDARAENLRQLIEGCGARAAAESYIEGAVTEARRVLAGLDIPSSSRIGLGEIADYLGGRSR